MASLVRVLSSPRTSGTTGGLRFALALSALAHWALLTTPFIETRRPGAVPSAINASMTVRFAPPPGAVPDGPAVTDAVERHLPRPPASNSGRAGSHYLPATAVAPPDAAAPEALRILDPNYYSALELDAYPHPARPLELKRLSGAGSIRLLLLIDEHGVVTDLSLIEAGAASRLDEALRTALAAARFIPARKDGRAVRSRIVLSVGFDPKSGER
jgi:protein TonB